MGIFAVTFFSYFFIFLFFIISLLYVLNVPSVRSCLPLRINGIHRSTIMSIHLLSPSPCTSQRSEIVLCSYYLTTLYLLFFLVLLCRIIVVLYLSPQLREEVSFCASAPSRIKKIKPYQWQSNIFAVLLLYIWCLFDTKSVCWLQNKIKFCLSILFMLFFYKLLDVSGDEKRTESFFYTNGWCLRFCCVIITCIKDICYANETAECQCWFTKL